MNKKAFTLLETAIVLGIMAMVVSGGLAIYKVQFMKERMDVTRKRMDDIRNAIADFKLKNNRLPCPASLKTSPGTSGFGKEVTPTCATIPAQGAGNWGLLTGTADGTFRPQTLPTAHTVRIGAIPVVDLGLPAETIMDGWGRRYVYAVSEELANQGTAYSDANGGIKLLAFNGTDTLGPNPDQTPFVVISMGKSGVGGYTFEGNPTGQTCTDAGPDERENCDYATNATFRTKAYSESNNTADRFDDIIASNIGNLSGFPSDAVTVCGNLGKIYGPGNAGADTNGCISGPMLGNTTAPCNAQNTGLQRYNAGTLEICNGSAWAAVGGGGSSSGIVVEFKCGWFNGHPGGVGSCTPPSCPAGATDLGTSSSAMASDATYWWGLLSGGYNIRYCKESSYTALLTVSCGWFNGHPGGVGSCTPPSCPAGWTNRGTGNTVNGAGGDEQYWGLTSAGRSERYCVQ